MTDADLAKRIQELLWCDIPDDTNRDVWLAQRLAACERERDAALARVAESAQAVADGLEDHAKAMAEIERLRARVADFQQIATNAVKEQGRLGTKLAAIEHNIWERQDAADREIERLRAGLREIAGDHSCPMHSEIARRLLGAS